MARASSAACGVVMPTASGATIPAAVTVATVADPVASRSATAIAQPRRITGTWASFADARPGLVAGISAVPSLHVAISLWIFLVARSLDRRAAALAFAYFLVMWIASVQLGWHYAVDGLAGALGMLLVWRIASGATARHASSG